MGGAFSGALAWLTGRGGAETTDLTEEEIEELRMTTAFSAAELRALRRAFKAVCNDESLITPAIFFEMPAVRSNPLQAQLIKCFNFVDGALDFRAFVIGASVFSQHGNPDQKLRVAFKLHDFDDDGRISAEDLRTYLEKVTKFSDASTLSENIDLIVKKTLAEAVPEGEDRDYLTFADFSKVVSPTDFESKLLLNFMGG